MRCFFKKIRIKNNTSATPGGGTTTKASPPMGVVITGLKQMPTSSWRQPRLFAGYICTVRKALQPVLPATSLHASVIKGHMGPAG